MKDYFGAFSTKKVCLPLISDSGILAAKYRLFKALLAHNHAALNAIASIEQEYYSGRPVPLSSVRIKHEELLEAV